jgi:hypothetical protein
MRIKFPRCIRTGAQLVHREIDLEFKERVASLPPEWVTALVLLACFPTIASQPVGEESVKAFADFFAHDPDLALEVLCFARERRLRHGRADKTKFARVRTFFLWNELLLEQKNSKGEKELHYVLNRVLDSGRPYKIIPVASLQDKDIAAFLFGPKCPDGDVEIVKTVRQSLSQKQTG